MNWSDRHYLLNLLLCAGMLAETGLLLASNLKRDRIRLLALPLIWGFAYFISSVSFDPQDYYLRMIVPVVAMGVSAAFIFAGEILPAITKFHALSYTLVFWYVIAAVRLAHGPADPVFLTICAVFSAAALLSLLPSGRAGAVLRPASYIWYIFVVVYTAAAQFSGNAALNIDPDVPAARLPGVLPVFVAGMALMFLVVIFTELAFITLLSLNAGRYPGRDPRRLFRKKFPDIPARSRAALAGVLLLQALLTMANYRLGLLAPFFFANCCLLAMPRLVSMQLAADPADLQTQDVF